MQPDKPVVANFIIGGTEKAGTTSVFSYLSEHPQVCGSTIKETNFFRWKYAGDRDTDLRLYARYFPRCERGTPIVMEASPAYLGCANEVAPRIGNLLPNARLLFILRNPIERAYSSYHFHVGRLDISEEISFEEYVRRCIAYERNDGDPLRLDRWNLEVLRFGRYAEFLEPFFSHLPRDHIKVMFFEDLRADPAGFMKELSGFLGIDNRFWEGYGFFRANATFSSRNKLLHRAAIALNNKAERHLRRRPRLKQALVNLYKALNQAREGYDPMSAAARERLVAYYRPSIRALAQLLDTTLPAAWQTAEEKSPVNRRFGGDAVAHGSGTEDEIDHSPISDASHNPRRYDRAAG